MEQEKTKTKKQNNKDSQLTEQRFITAFSRTVSELTVVILMCRGRPDCLLAWVQHFSFFSNPLLTYKTPTSRCQLHRPFIFVKLWPTCAQQGPPQMSPTATIDRLLHPWGTNRPYRIMTLPFKNLSHNMASVSHSQGEPSKLSHRLRMFIGLALSKTTF